MPVGDRVLSLLMATRNDIWAIVLMRGVPLKIAQDSDDYFGMETKPELQTNAAAVDTELALLPIFGLPLGGFVPNIFYENQPGGIKLIGPELSRNMILVTRLDGPSVADVRRMIDDSLYAEQHRLAGLAVVDSRGITNPHDGYFAGDEWLRGARDALVKDGWTVKFDDDPNVLPPTDPCNQVALYLGWYRQDAYGPWMTPPPRFVRGAIAYHLHSFSANTIRSDTANWVGPLIAHGADATMGNRLRGPTSRSRRTRTSSRAASSPATTSPWPRTPRSAACRGWSPSSAIRSTARSCRRSTRRWRRTPPARAPTTTTGSSSRKCGAATSRA